jgi:hypothetical protein
MLANAQAEGQLERKHRFMRSNFETGRSFANHLDFQDQLDTWSDIANGRVHRGIRAVPADRLAQERQQRPLGEVTLDTDRRSVLRVPQQPLVRVDRNHYSIDPRSADATPRSATGSRSASERSSQRRADRRHSERHRKQPRRYAAHRDQQDQLKITGSGPSRLESACPLNRGRSSVERSWTFHSAAVTH